MQIVITGASRGIGYATALNLAADSAHKIYVLSRNIEALEALADVAAERYGHRTIHPISCDLANFDATALSEIEEVDVLIHNAGLLLQQPFEESTLANWQAIFEVNVFGVVRLTQALLPQLKRSPKAHVVHVGSMGGVQGSSKFPGLSAYSCSKAAITGLTECLAEEFKDTNIRFNCLALGAVQTEMLAAAFPGYQAPLSSEKMAEFFAYFALQGHQFFNGKILPVAVSTP